MSENRILRPTFTVSQLKTICNALWLNRLLLHRQRGGDERESVVIMVNID